MSPIYMYLAVPFLVPLLLSLNNNNINNNNNYVNKNVL